ncbi:hypothetical protein HK096_003406, partial [Nowakowskiella sp. JEL0078]
MPGKKQKGNGEGKKSKGGSAKKKKDGEQEAARELLTSDLKNLRGLYIQHCENFITEPLNSVSTRINKAIVSAEVIDKIIITSASVTRNDMYALTSTFQLCNTLNSVYLWMVKMDSKGLEALVKFFSTHSTASTLHLIDCGITPDMSSHLADVARNSKTLTSLVLDHNPLQSYGVIQIFNGIRENKYGSLLRKCSLKFCEAGPECGETISTTLASNVSI